VKEKLQKKQQRPLGEEVQRASFDVMNGWEEEGHSSFEAAMGGGECRSETFTALRAGFDRTASRRRSMSRI
jgi:hypothetical protein